MIMVAANIITLIIVEYFLCFIYSHIFSKVSLKQNIVIT